MIELHGVSGHRFRNCQEVYAAARDANTPDRTPSPRFLALLAVSKRDLATTIYGELVTKCQEIDGHHTALASAFLGGIVGGYAKDVIDLEAAMKAHELAKRRARDELDRAVAEFEASGLKPTNEMSTSELKRLEERAATLAAQIGRIASVQSELLPRNQVIASETLNELEAALAAVAGENAEGRVSLEPDAQRAIAMVRAVPSLADEASKLFKDANKPRLVPFLAAIDHQRLIVESFEAREQIKNKELDAAHKRFAASMSEAGALAATRRLLKPAWADASIAELDTSLSGDDKATFYRALAIYGDDVERFRVDSAVWSIRKLAAQHEEALVQSKYAAAQWDGLLDTMATVLADYHAAGLKQSEIAEFLKALGLVGIGVGVAQ